MAMLRTVVSVQWTILRRDKMVWALLATFVALLVYTGVGGLNATAAQEERITEAIKAEAERLAHIRASLEKAPPPEGKRLKPGSLESDPYQVGHDLGRRVLVLRPGPAALLTQPDPSARPNVLEVTLGSQLEDPAAASRQLSAGRLALGGVDLAFVLIYLLPLLIIGLTYDLLLGEREQKTLALVLSQPVSMARFLVGKLVARAGLVAVATLVPLMVLFAIGAPWSTASGALAVALTLAVVGAYMAFWFAAAAAANAWMRSSASSALALMGLWLFCLVLAPGLLRLAVETLHPPPSRVKLVNLSRQASQEAESALTGIEGNHGAKAAADYQLFLDKKVKAHEHMEDALHDVLHDFDVQLARQQEVVGWLQLVSPAIVMQEALADLAGDGVDRHQHFKEQAETYHDEYQAFFFGLVKERQHVRLSTLEQIPAPSLSPEPAANVVKRTSWALLWLLLPAALLALASRKRLTQIGRL